MLEREKDQTKTKAKIKDLDYDTHKDKPQTKTKIGAMGITTDPVKTKRKDDIDILTNPRRETKTSPSFLQHASTCSTMTSALSTSPVSFLNA